MKKGIRAALWGIAGGLVSAIAAMMLALVFAAVAQAGPDDDARAALALAAAKINPVVEPIVPKAACQCAGDPARCECRVCDCPAAYAAFLTAAARDRRPVVVFVGVPVLPTLYRALPYQAAAGRFSGDGYPARCIIISNPDGSWRATLPATATSEEINAVLRGPVVQAVPMQSYAPTRQAASC